MPLKIKWKFRYFYLHLIILFVYMWKYILKKTFTYLTITFVYYKPNDSCQCICLQLYMVNLIFHPKRTFSCPNALIPSDRRGTDKIKENLVGHQKMRAQSEQVDVKRNRGDREEGKEPNKRNRERKEERWETKKAQELQKKEEDEFITSFTFQQNPVSGQEGQTNKDGEHWMRQTLEQRLRRIHKNCTNKTRQYLKPDRQTDRQTLTAPYYLIYYKQT